MKYEIYLNLDILQQKKTKMTTTIGALPVYNSDSLINKYNQLQNYSLFYWVTLNRQNTSILICCIIKKKDTQWIYLPLLPLLYM